MALRSVAATIWGPAAFALRRQPGPGVPPPPALSRFLGTTVSQANPLSNIIKIIQQDAVYMHELENLLVELEKFTEVAKQRAVELEQVRRQKKKAQKIYGFTLAAVACMGVYLYNTMPTPMVEQGNTSRLPLELYLYKY